MSGVPRGGGVCVKDPSGEKGVVRFVTAKPATDWTNERAWLPSGMDSSG